jgi:hypothetical protein
MNNDSTENGSAFLGFNRGAIGKGFEADDEWRVHGIVWECLCNDNLISTSAGTKEILPTVLQCRLSSPRPIVVLHMPAPPEFPPPFGHQLRQYFGFESNYVNLNHG